MNSPMHRLLYQQRRKINDFYSTPANITEALLEVESFDGMTIWEPACGEGHISKVLLAHGLDVYSSDLVDRGFGDVEKNFFSTWPECDAVITNPPYLDGLSLAFANRSILIAKKKVAFLLPLNFLETPRRSLFVQKSPLKCVYVFAKRVFTLRYGFEGEPAAKTCFCWFVWEKGWTAEPVLRWIK